MKSPMLLREILKSQLFRFSITTLLHLAMLSPVYILIGLADDAAAYEIAAGMAVVEEGDDRMRPAMALHGAINDYAGRLYYYGRKFGPIKEETILISAHRRFSIFGTDFIKAQLGVAAMDESTKISYEGNDSHRNEEEHHMNVGAAAGVSVSLPANMKPFYAHFSWDSHLFPAGLGGILLSTGRKQTLSLAAGVLF